MPQTPPNKRLMIATENTHKLAEMQAYFNEQSLGIEVVLPDSLVGLEETGKTFVDNAILKVQFVQTQAQQAQCDWVLGDDSGFSVAALAGMDGLPLFPGVYSNRWLTPQRRATLLGAETVALTEPITHPHRCMGIFALLEETPNRQGAYHCAMALLTVATGNIQIVEGICPVHISEKPILLGTNGFGYDPMVSPVLDSGISHKTMAQWSMAEKNTISHRGKALQQLLPYLK